MQREAVSKFLGEWKTMYGDSKTEGYLQALKNVIRHVKDFLISTSPGTTHAMVVVEEIVWDQDLFTAFYVYLIKVAKIQSNSAEYYTYCLVAYLHQNAIGFTMDKNMLKTVFRTGNIQCIDQKKAIHKAKNMTLSLKNHCQFYKLVGTKARSLEKFDKQLFELLPLLMVGFVSYQQGLRTVNMLVPDNDDDYNEFMGGDSRGTKKCTHIYPPDNDEPWVQYHGPWDQFDNVEEQELFYKDIWLYEKTPKNPKPKNFVLRTSLKEEILDETYPFRMGIRGLAERYNDLIDHWSERDPIVKLAKEKKYLVTTKGKKREFTPCSTRAFTNTANRVMKPFIRAKKLPKMTFSTYGMKREGVTTSLNNEFMTATQHRIRHAHPSTTKKYWHPKGPVVMLRYQLMTFSPGNVNDRNLDADK